MDSEETKEVAVHPIVGKAGEIIDRGMTLMRKTVIPFVKENGVWALELAKQRENSLFLGGVVAGGCSAYLLIKLRWKLLPGHKSCKKRQGIGEKGEPYQEVVRTTSLNGAVITVLRLPHYDEPLVVCKVKNNYTDLCKDVKDALELYRNLQTSSSCESFHSKPQQNCDEWLPQTQKNELLRREKGTQHDAVDDAVGPPMDASSTKRTKDEDAESLNNKKLDDECRNL